MRDVVEWILEYGKYAVLAAAIFYGLQGAGVSIGEGVSRITTTAGIIVQHSMFVGKGDGPMISITDKGISAPDATKFDMP